MFAALRSYFRPSGDPAAPASRRRWHRTLRLFAFEFLVVVAGVLAAQGLQSWVAEREHRERVAGVAERPEVDPHSALTYATIGIAISASHCRRPSCVQPVAS